MGSRGVSRLFLILNIPFMLGTDELSELNDFSKPRFYILCNALQILSRSEAIQVK